MGEEKEADPEPCGDVALKRTPPSFSNHQMAEGAPIPPRDDGAGQGGGQGGGGRKLPPDISTL